MAYIYKITNKVNEKIYIGKTEQSIEKRFQQHCKDSQRDNIQNRPLYKAMNKYGIDSFSVELIEETDCPEEREQYWIKLYDSFRNGYNATLGGDGKKYIDYDLVVESYRRLLNLTKVAKELNIDAGYASTILNLKGEPVLSSPEVAIKEFGKITNMYDLEDNFLRTQIGRAHV